jgi:nucleotidyltransferase/DNA polymerase involved in DNA repair
MNATVKRSQSTEAKMAQYVADLTLDELRQWVDERIEHRLQALLKPTDNRTVREINESIRRHRWTPPPGAPSNLELLREDRDR